MRLPAIFALVALAEVVTFFWVGSEIGLLRAFGIAVATAILGGVLVGRAGLSVIGELRRRLNRGQFPGRELSDAAAILVSGAFLISPGFISDLLGFLLLIPVVQTAIYQLLSRRFSRRVGTFTTNFRSAGRSRADARRVIDVDSLESASDWRRRGPGR